MVSTTPPMRTRMTDYINELQETIVSKLETYGSGEKFRRESWSRDEGGGGLACTFPPLNSTASTSFPSHPPNAAHPPDGADHPIEKAAVNTSTIHGVLPPAAVKQMSTAHAALKDIDKSLPFFAAGLSVVLHPRHPRVPSVHANYRLFQVLDAPPPHAPDDPEPAVLAWWFGAITNMTPAYVNAADFSHFHATLRAACDSWSDAEHTAVSIYPPLKASCDDYLFIPHRHEHRGIGGVRFDDMDSDAMRALLRGQRALPEALVARLSDQASLFGLVSALGDAFLPSFIDVLERRVDAPWVPLEKRWQRLRRGRSVEFSLVVERGTKFGLATPGINAENVLATMPPEARWEYCSELGAEDQDTEEAEMTRILKKPRSWVD